MNSIRWYKVFNGKVFHAFESPCSKKLALCGSASYPMNVLIFKSITNDGENAFRAIQDPYIRTFEKKKFCKKCWEKLEKLENSGVNPDVSTD